MIDFFNPEFIEGWTSGKKGGAEVENFAGEIYTFANPRFIESCSHESKQAYKKQLSPRE